MPPSAPPRCRRCSARAADASFHRITVDGDTSTSDTLLAFATGQAGNPPLTAPHPAFQAALTQVCADLARQIVRDGEGAQKFITVHVTGAQTDQRRAPDRALDRQFAAREDRDRGRRRQLGARRHGGRQGGRGGGPRPAGDPFGGTVVARDGAVVPGMTRHRSPRIWRAARSKSASIWGSARARPRFGPATSPTATSRSTPTTAVDRQPERAGFARNNAICEGGRIARRSTANGPRASDRHPAT